MFTDIVVHVMFQVALASIMFWGILIPSGKETVRLQTQQLVENTIQPDILGQFGKEVFNNVTYVRQVSDILSQPDPYAYRKNTHVMMINVILLFTIFFAGFCILICNSCGVTVLPIMFELFVTYCIVFLTQVLFVKFIIMNYYPTTESEMAEQIIKSIDATCLHKSV